MDGEKLSLKMMSISKDFFQRELLKDLSVSLHFRLILSTLDLWKGIKDMEKELLLMGSTSTKVLGRIIFLMVKERRDIPMVMFIKEIF